MTGIDPSRFVFLDETSTPITLTPLRARAPRGQRAVGYVPRGQRPPIAWLATLTPSGLGESLLVKGTIDQRVFSTFVERVLVPGLRPGQIVILDNLAVHKSAQLGHALRLRGAIWSSCLPILPTSTRSSRPLPRSSRRYGGEVPAPGTPSPPPWPTSSRRSPPPMPRPSLPMPAFLSSCSRSARCSNLIHMEFRSV